MVNRKLYNEIVPFLMHGIEAIVHDKDYERFLSSNFVLNKSIDAPLYSSISTWKILTEWRTQSQFLKSVIFRILLIFATVPIVFCIIFLLPFWHVYKAMVDKNRCCVAFLCWPTFYVTWLLYVITKFMAFLGPLVIFLYWGATLMAIIDEMADFICRNEDYCYLRNPYALIISNFEYSRREQLNRIWPFHEIIQWDEYFQNKKELTFHLRYTV